MVTTVKLCYLRSVAMKRRDRGGGYHRKIVLSEVCSNEEKG